MLGGVIGVTCISFIISHEQTVSNLGCNFVSLFLRDLPFQNLFTYLR